MTVSLLTIDGLAVRYGTGNKAKQALEDCHLSLAAGEILAVVGESGSGKSTLARAVAGIAPVSAGRIRLDGQDLATLRGDARRKARRSIQMVFQDPDASLNPRHSIRTILSEPLEVIGFGDRAARTARIAALMALVHLDLSLLDRRPAGLSGGQKQRVAIARALAMEPRVLIADEALSALDVSTQAAVAALFTELRDRLGLAILFISHDMGMVRQLADHVCVIRGGRIAEAGPVATLMQRPTHPYTNLLLAASLDPKGALADPELLAALTRPGRMDEDYLGRLLAAHRGRNGAANAGEGP
ncbi:ABC transporter ATP-binding protein [Niveispirillum sp.]|uniref:ABC transporter ATP-binding protein n=1 Tax=Niveispirillum sp. TaxID=1917217 RepID=UPI001B7536EE|nr:ATP-binding cassette domain-containing protein [Niveispirillum sp.]MBP7335591.1 ABC transporter ATP-binding protein [Niveispirillum sp.]